MAEHEDHFQNLVNQLVDGRYFIIELLGRGAFGEVYLAEERIFGMNLRRAALKVFHKNQINTENATDVLNDIFILCQLQEEQSYEEIDQYLVRFIDMGFLKEADDRVYMAMEYVQGYQLSNGVFINTLNGLIEAYKPIPVKLALRWMIQIIKPLAWMHTLDKPVLHSDLKPHNILASGQDKLKLADFGLSKLVYGISSAGVKNSGTLIYSAPELLTGNQLTTATDIYSLGLVFYEIITGKNPFKQIGVDALASKDENAYIQEQLNAREDLDKIFFPDPDGWIKDRPLIAELIKRCLNFMPSERPDNAQILLQELQSYQKERKNSVFYDDVKTDTQDFTQEDTELSLEGYETLMKLFIKKKNWTQALEQISKAKVENPKSWVPLYYLAKIYVEQGKWQDALPYISKGFGLGPRAYQLFEVAAEAYDAGKQHAVARQMRQKADQLRRKHT